MIEEQQELRKLDARLAVVLGWTRTDHEGGLWVEPGTQRYVYELPSFSTDWGAAGLLADWLREHGWGIEVKALIDGWDVVVAKTQFADLHGYGYGPIFALALSRAVDNAYQRATATL